VAAPSWFWGGCSWPKNGEYVCPSAIKGWSGLPRVGLNPCFTHQIDMLP
jgi:hypothetical protein